MWIKPGMLVWDNSANSHNNWGESPQAFCQTLPKRVFSVTNTMQAFGHLSCLSCTDFNHFWKNRQELMSKSICLWEISEFLQRGFASPQKTDHGSSILGGMLVISLQLKRHNFARQKSFWGLVDIPRMCLFVRELWWGMCYDSQKTCISS